MSGPFNSSSANYDSDQLCPCFVASGSPCLLHPTFQTTTALSYVKSAPSIFSGNGRDSSVSSFHNSDSPSNFDGNPFANEGYRSRPTTEYLQDFVSGVPLFGHGYVEQSLAVLYHFDGSPAPQSPDVYNETNMLTQGMYELTGVGQHTTLREPPSSPVLEGSQLRSNDLPIRSALPVQPGQQLGHPHHKRRIDPIPSQRRQGHATKKSRVSKFRDWDPTKASQMKKTEQQRAQADISEDKAPPRVKCEQCNRYFKDKASLRKHKTTHEPGYDKKKNQICSKCSKSFHWRKDLLRHDAVHDETRKFRCLVKECDYSAEGTQRGMKRQDHIIRHLITKHGWSKELAKDEVDNIYSSGTALPPPPPPPPPPQLQPTETFTGRVYFSALGA